MKSQTALASHSWAHPKFKTIPPAVRGSPDPAHGSDRRSPRTFVYMETFGHLNGGVWRPSPSITVYLERGLSLVLKLTAALVIIMGVGLAVEKCKAISVTHGGNRNDMKEKTQYLTNLDPAGKEKPKIPSLTFTTFQTPTGYREDHDLKTGSVIVYNSSKEAIQSWLEKGYDVQTMYGFRTGDDYIRDHPDEGQTDSVGHILHCGPGSYYMVPTQSRIDAALSYYRQAIENGASAVVPEEPEFFANAGYSESFKREWQAYYNEPWQDQTTSVEARYKSERLKAYLEYRMVKSIMEFAEKQNPKVRRMVACHSPVSYYAWGIIYPHWQVVRIPQLQEVIGQVWTGTARSACKYEGQSRERTFENGYLEYSSLYNQMRGTGKRLWFLMDPLEDNPDRAMTDYRENYHLTLVASLMFPDVDAFEVLPWPDRIFGRVPADFATEITSVIRVLDDMHNQKSSSLDSGTTGIATFTADSMGWQRGEPYPSNMDAFYGLTFPLLYKGIPVQVAQLERSAQAGYLDRYKVLLLTYDLLKPLKDSYNIALARWVKKGGVLIFFGGTDPYNAVPEWWRKEGYVSPQEHLFTQLGLNVSVAGLASTPDLEPIRFIKSQDNWLTREFPEFEVPFGIKLTSYSTSATALYSAKASGKVFFEHEAGKGKLIFCGIEPSFFAQSSGSADLMRAIVRYGCAEAGIKYREQGHLAIKRGRYLAVRTLGDSYSIRGNWVDILDPSLRLIRKENLPPWSAALLCDVSDRMGKMPRLLFCSSKVEQINEESGKTYLFVSGPANVEGVARIWKAGRKLMKSVASDSNGENVKTEIEDEGDTLLVKYTNRPKGVVVRLFWE